MLFLRRSRYSHAGDRIGIIFVESILPLTGNCHRAGRSPAARFVESVLLRGSKDACCYGHKHVQTKREKTGVQADKWVVFAEYEGHRRAHSCHDTGEHARRGCALPVQTTDYARKEL